jgi:peptidylprolyl isomerase
VKVEEGRVVTLDYTVKLADGTLVDSTGGCGPLAIVYGAGQLFPALEDRIGGMEPGETRELTIPADEAYGPWHAELVRSVPRDRLPPDLDLVPGQEYRLQGPEGKAFRFRVLEIGDTEVRADFNPPSAGQDLVATVTVLAVRAATADEERRGRV